MTIILASGDNETGSVLTDAEESALAEVAQAMLADGEYAQGFSWNGPIWMHKAGTHPNIPLYDVSLAREYLASKRVA